MATLKEKSEEILTEKELKIIPENIKKDVQIFDVVGTLDSVITEEELENINVLTANILG